MSKYLIKGNYVGDGIAGLMAQGGTARENAARAAAESVGGSLESMYFAFGDTDVFAICDMPSDAAATAMSLLINSSGAVEISLTPLMTAADVDGASAITGSYSPPGS